VKRVCLTFDDGLSETWTNFHRDLSSRGVRATWGIVTRWMDTPGYLTFRQVEDIQADGHEIASHGVTHQLMSKLDNLHLKAELCHSRRILGATTFIYPRGDTSGTVINFVRKSYRGARGIHSGYYNLYDPDSKWNMPCFMYGKKTPLAEADARFDAITRDCALIECYHLVGKGHRKDGLVTDPKWLKSHVEYILKRGGSLITLRELLKCTVSL